MSFTTRVSYQKFAKSNHIRVSAFGEIFIKTLLDCVVGYLKQFETLNWVDGEIWNPGAW